MSKEQNKLIFLSAGYSTCQYVDHFGSVGDQPSQQRDHHPYHTSLIHHTHSIIITTTTTTATKTEISCSWCHVMERESFENEDIAKIMNEHFINIKVDREERPD